MLFTIMYYFLPFDTHQFLLKLLKSDEKPFAPISMLEEIVQTKMNDNEFLFIWNER